jgi:hypothetical protein
MKEHYSMIKTINISAASAFVAFTALVGATGASAGEAGIRLAPLKGIGFDVGAKHAVGYFLSQNGACAVTLVVADAMTDENVAPQAGARVSVSVADGKSVRLDTAAGKSLEFACTASATAMTVRPVEQMAWVAPKK